MSVKITKQSHYRKKITQRALPMEEVIALIKSEQTCVLVNDFREKLLYAYPNTRYPFTQKLPQLLFSGLFRKSELKIYNGWILLEINHIPTEDVKLVRKKVAEYPQTLFAMIGASGRSVKFVVPYTRPDGSLPDTFRDAKLFHAHAYRHALKTYEARLAYPIELKQPRLDSACRLSYDADVYYNPDALAIHIEQPTEMPEESAYQEQHIPLPMGTTNHVQTDYDRFRYHSIQYEWALENATEEQNTEEKRGDYKPIIVRLGQLCAGIGLEEEVCVRWTILYFKKMLSEPEIRETLHHAYASTKGFGTHVLSKPEQLQALKTEEFMNRRYDFRFNTMTDWTEYKEKGSFCFDYRPVTERVMNSIALNAQKEGLQLWDRDVRRYIYSDRIRNYSPIESYLSRLPAWDGKDRIRPLATRITCDNPHWEHLFYTWFLSMVAHWQGRDRQHGNSVSPLLVGEQGCGKSTFCFNLLPPELKTYYTDSIDFSKRRDAELYLTRFGLINIDEFDQISDKHQGFLKHLLQKPVVNLRKPYASQVTAVRRYASFIATSNHTDLLNDPSGSRRFICVEVKGRIDNTQPVEYEQLYAQAITALDKGERYWLTHEEEQKQMQANEEFRQRPLWEELFYDFYRPSEHKEEGVKMSAGEIFLSLQQKSSTKFPLGQVARFGRFLRKCVPIAYNTKRGKMYLVVEKEK